MRKKKTFEVYVTRKYIHAATIRVEAWDKHDAELTALGDIDDTVMSMTGGLPDDDTAEVIREIK